MAKAISPILIKSMCNIRLDESLIEISQINLTLVITFSPMSLSRFS